MTTEEILNESLTRAQEECTRLLLENRRLRMESASSLFGAVCDVGDFFLKFGVPMARKPAVPPADRKALRKELLYEEACELDEAIDHDDLVGIADGIADLIYVAIGTALEFGIPLARVWAEVHRTNMLKAGGATREDGKILKPEGWQAPDIQSIITEASR